MVDSFEQAQAIKQTLAASLSDEAKMPIAMAVEEFLAAKRKQGLKPLSVQVWVDRLALLPRDVAMAELTPADAKRSTTDGQALTPSPRTAPGAAFARGFFAWAIERGYVTRNPSPGEADRQTAPR